MPTYEYRSQKGHEFEVFQRMSEPPVDKCPQCGAPAERKLSAGAGVLFKGSGFYITDYRSDKYIAERATEFSAAYPWVTAWQAETGDSLPLPDTFALQA
mgnify:CR=1 FL=1